MATIPKERFPNDLKLTLDDFLASGWRETLAPVDRHYYTSMWSALSNAAQQAMADGTPAKGKALWLLADACSMRLQPDSVNSPLEAWHIGPTGRSAIPEDFDLETIELFAQAIDHLDNPMLKARLAETVWLVQTPRQVRYALAAVDAYRELPFDTETWARDVESCHRRALRLAIALGKGAGARLPEMEAAVLTAIESAKADDGYLALWLANLLHDTRLGRDHPLQVAQKLEKLAIEFDKTGDLHRSRDYFDTAAQWYESAKDEIKSVEMIRGLAEGWVTEANVRSSGEDPSFMIAAELLQYAIHAYRRIPAKRRDDFKVNERLTELHKMMTQASQRSLDEMGVIQSPSIDITEIVNNSQKTVSGKSFHEALLAFAGIRGTLSYAKMRDSAKDLMAKHPLSQLFAATMMSHDGRVIARRPPAGLSGIKDDDPALWAEVVKNYTMEINLIIQGIVWPALQTLTVEHRIRLEDLITVARQSPMVPPGREVYVGKALYAGFEQDFTSAIHLLTPQVEHSIRWHLKLRDIKTTVLDSEGIETEVGLSTLLEKPEVKQIFGEDYTFELNALFSDSFGPNLRNEVAHGLMGPGGGESTYSVYAWWWFFSLVFKAFASHVIKNATAGDSHTTDSSGPEGSTE